jgi:hypothetical protein
LGGRRFVDLRADDELHDPLAAVRRLRETHGRAFTDLLAY